MAKYYVIRSVFLCVVTISKPVQKTLPALLLNRIAITFLIALVCAKANPQNKGGVERYNYFYYTDFM